MSTQAEVLRRRALSDELLEEIRAEFDDVKLQDIITLLLAARGQALMVGDDAKSVVLAVGSCCVAIVAAILTEQAEAAIAEAGEGT